MIAPKKFFNKLIKHDIKFFCGVPDSLLKDFCAYVTDHTDKNSHVITANEGIAIGLAAGYYLANKRPALVYMQNSGLGNTVNPLASLADSRVYGIPMLLVVGWRGEPGTKDEPQHIKQGEITLDLLKVLGIPYEILDGGSDFDVSIERALEHMKCYSEPYAFVVKKGAFDSYKLKTLYDPMGVLTREEALETILEQLVLDDVIVSTTGKLSRELYEQHQKNGKKGECDFLTVGSMGHASSIACGISICKPHRDVYCFDGDGAALMHMGSWSTIGSLHPQNFCHIVFNNGMHDSVGGQPTTARTIDFVSIAKACGYREAVKIFSKEEICKTITTMKRKRGPSFIEICIRSGTRSDLGRPVNTPEENKKIFMEGINR